MDVNGLQVKSDFVRYSYIVVLIETIAILYESI